jgi:hypothetical protein
MATHGALDVLAFVPVFGAIADVANAGSKFSSTVAKIAPKLEKSAKLPNCSIGKAATNGLPVVTNVNPSKVASPKIVPSLTKERYSYSGYFSRER